MPKSPSLTDVTGTFADITVNNNSRKIENAFENTLSRDGSTPNQMEADLDLNNNDLLNVKTITTKDLVVEGQGSVQNILSEMEELRDEGLDIKGETEEFSIVAQEAAEEAEEIKNSLLSDLVVQAEELDPSDPPSANWDGDSLTLSLGIPAGDAATVEVGNVTTGAPGSSAQVTNSGTNKDAILDFVLPRGSTGPAGPGSGDMLASSYDPQGIGADVFDLTRMTGVLPLSKGGTGGVNATAARNNLGLVKTTSNLDSNRGRVLSVGDFGVGSYGALLDDSTDLDTLLVGGIYHWTTSRPTNAPPANYGLLWVGGSANASEQRVRFLTGGNEGAEYYRTKTGSRWSSWVPSNIPFPSRTSAESSIIPGGVTALELVHNGKKLRYVRDPNGTALTTGGGVTWSPDVSLPVWVEHWGAVGFNTPAEAVVDSTAAIQAGMFWCRGELLMDGWYKVTDGIQRSNDVRGAKLHCVRGRNHGGFSIDTDFNLSAKAVLYAQPGQRAGWEIGALGFNFVHPTAKVSGNRADLIHYPPAMYIGKETSARFEAIQIVAGYDGIVTDDNAGALRIGILDIGCFNVGLKLDGLLGACHVESIRAWPFGAAGTPLADVFYDQQSDAIRLGRVDGWSCDKLLSFRQKVTLNTVNGTASIPTLWGSMQMDGDGADLIVNAGNHVISNWYSTRSASATTPPLLVTGGRVSISNARFTGSSPTEIEVTGGVCSINGGCIGKNNIGRYGAKVSGGELALRNMGWYWGGNGVRSQPLVEQTSAGRLLVEGCFCEDTTHPSVLISTANARYHYIDARPLSPHSISIADTSVGEYFTAPVSDDITFSFENAGNLSVAYTSRQFSWFLEGRKVVWNLRVVFIPTYSVASNAAFFSVPNFPTLSGAKEVSPSLLTGVNFSGDNSGWCLRGTPNNTFQLLEYGEASQRVASVTNFQSGRTVTLFAGGEFFL